jgi:glycerol-3-phosphate cytidylyltransferase
MKSNTKIKSGIIAGNFDVIHPGYIKMFKEAASLCNEVIVALHRDPSIERPSKLKPILSIEERIETLESIKYINKIFVYDLEKDLECLIKDLKPDIRLLGEDYRNRTDYTGFGLCPETHYFDRSHGWSTAKFKQVISTTVK